MPSTATLSPGIIDGRYRVDPETACWLWTGFLTSTGYGGVYVARKLCIASRVSWETHRGPIPKGLCVLHHCDVRPCINPEHLFLGTKGDNNRDCAAKGRYPNQKRTHCPHGHAYSPENTYHHGGQRFCRACHRASHQSERRRP